MSARHFRKIAARVASVRSISDRIVLAHDLATDFAAENPRFDRARFLTACDVPVAAPALRVGA